MILSIYCFVALNFKSYGTFCILKSSITSYRILPTTEIIEPLFFFVVSIIPFDTSVLVEVKGFNDGNTTVVQATIRA